LTTAGCTVEDAFFGWGYQLKYKKFTDPSTGNKKYHADKDAYGCTVGYVFPNADDKYFEGYQLLHGELERDLFTNFDLREFK